MGDENDQQNNDGNNGGHPAWQEILNVVPPEFHNLLTPKLQEWDQGVQNKLSEVRSQYDPYKELVDNNVTMDQIQQAMMLAMTLEQDPANVVEKAIEHFGLDQFKPQQQPTNNTIPDEDEEDEFDMSDLTLDQLQSHPAFKPFFEKQKQIEEWYNQQQETEQQTQAEQQLSEYLTELHNKHDEEYGKFDDLYVTALMSNGVDAEDAIKQYRETVNQAAQALTQSQNTQQQTTQHDQPPVVMGSTGNSGSGLPSGDIKMGELNNQQTNDLVLKILAEAQQNT